jgi:hypothetical protein
MIYVVKCQIDSLSISSLGIKMKKGDSFECPKRIYDSNIEIKSLISSGAVTSYPKMPVVQEVQRRGLIARTRIKATPPPEPKIVVQETVHHHEKVVQKNVHHHEKVVQETVHHHHESKVDLDDLASKLLEKLSGVISPEIIAQAVASQIPKQVVVQTSNAEKSFDSSSEELTFIPSKIISDELKSSSSNVSESSSQDEGLNDALSALRAMKKSKK